jgi:Na+/proline symporter
MTGVDQDMMQKNLTCKTLRGAQKDMCTYGVAFLPANLLFLSLGVLLVMWYQQKGIVLPAMGDELLPLYVGQAGSLVMVLFVLGIVAASFSSADSALTSLTTIYCVDILGQKDNEQLRKRTHLGMCAVFVLFILFFKVVNSTSLIDAIYIICGYTYGPLLGLFAYGLLTKRGVNDRLVPYIAVVSPLLCYAIDYGVGQTTGYHFGYELLMLNGLITFVGLYLSSKGQDD